MPIQWPGATAFASLTRNWLRSFLTILGISVGVGAFICVVAIGNTGSSKIVSDWAYHKHPHTHAASQPRNEVEIELGIVRHIARQSFDN
jgi:MacB-like periplasmic core domain